MNQWLRGSISIVCLATLWTSAWATVYELPADGSVVIGADEHVRSASQDTLLDLAHRYSLGYEEIIRANPKVDMWLPGDGGHGSDSRMRAHVSGGH